jgi:hypothetical protein
MGLFPKTEEGKNMQAICVHTWNPKATGMTEKEFLPAREKFMRNLITEKVPLKSLHAAFNWEKGKAWCIWETDTLERLESIMAEFPHIHTDIMPVKQAPQVK